MNVVTIAQMRELEGEAGVAGISTDALMEAAGLAIARRTNQIMDGISGKRITLLIGPGNNGGDGLVASKYLADWGALVTLYLTSVRRRNDKLDECRSRRIRIIDGVKDGTQSEIEGHITSADAVIDAVLGTGHNRPLDSQIQTVFRHVAHVRSQRPSIECIAIDIPSGLDGDSGACDGVCFQATATLALGAPKTGLYIFPGAENVGYIHILDIGLTAQRDEYRFLELNDSGVARTLLPKRTVDSHKGSFGKMLLVSGSRRFLGAPYLVSKAAYRTGTGLVVLAAPETASMLAGPAVPEQVHLPLPETVDGYAAIDGEDLLLSEASTASALVIGPGLGDVPSIQAIVGNILLSDRKLTMPCVIDADALNALSRTDQWWNLLQSEAILTPHPREMSRLLHNDISTIQRDRINTTRVSAHHWNKIVVLKGAHTIVASPDGRATISPYANPILATAGTGDVLAGIIGGLLAQGLAPYDAARLGVFIHGAAAETISQRMGVSGLLASDLHDEIPIVMNELRRRPN